MKTTLTFLAATAFSGAAFGQMGHESSKNVKHVIACPVTHTYVDMDHATQNHMYADFKGNRYFFCCADCPSKFLMNSAEYAGKPHVKAPLQDQKHEAMPQGSMGQGKGSPGMEEEEVAHPFLTHMGMPEPVGSNSLRVSGLTTSANGGSQGDFAFHYETGLTKLIGFHLRSDAFTTDPFTEAMFQYAAVRSKDGMSGISPLIEFEFPTRRAGSGIKTLLGFSSTLTLKHAAINQVLHYDPREKMLEGSIAYVCEASKGFYPVVELLGMAAKGEMPTLNVLFGPKVKVNKNAIVGIAFESPISVRKEFGSKVILQLELKW